jgi:hypothetical protein
MLGYLFNRASIAAQCSLLLACSVKRGLDSGSVAEGGSEATVSVAGSAGRAHNNTGGAPDTTQADESGSAGEAGNAASGQGAGQGRGGQGRGGQGAGPNGGDVAGAEAGESGAAGSAGTGSSGPPAECDLDGGSCNGSPPPTTCGSPTVQCGVVDPGFSCEFPEFVGVSVSVACGETAKVGTACCGACGCVDVEVYYDGKYCWQGIPGCWGGKFVEPRLPTH